MSKYVITVTQLFIIFFLITNSYFCQTDKKTEVWEPVPQKVLPGMLNTPPSDAIVLFGGIDLNAWVGEEGEPAWHISNGTFRVSLGTGDIWTKENFGSIQLHLEFMTPDFDPGIGQDKGNSGIYFQDRYEIQILDSYENETYVNGMAGAIYKQYVPLVNASLPPGTWQSFDVIYLAPKFNNEGNLVSPARMTVFYNHVLIHNNVELKGKTLWEGKPFYEPHGEAPIRLQDHDSKVSFKNIWVRRLD